MIKFRNIVFAFAVLTNAAFALANDILRFGDFLPATTRTATHVVPEFIAKAAELSDGTLKIQYYPGGTLGSNGKMQLKLVEDGVLDIAQVVTPYTPGRIVGLDVLELPGLFSSNHEGGMLAKSLYDNDLIDGLDHLKVLAFQEVGPYLIHSKKEIRKLSDIKGLKFRVVGAAQTAIIESLGGIAVGNIAANQIHENLTRGVIDGALMDMGNLINFKMDKSTFYHVTNLYLGGNAVIYPIRKEKYNSLSEKSQQALDTLSKTWFTDFFGKEMDLQAKEVKEKLMNDKKHHFVEFSEQDLAAAKLAFTKYLTRYLTQDPKNKTRLDHVQK